MSAAQRVFRITELAEQILSPLGVTTLAVVRRVCRDCNAMITTSKVLRRISFLEPEPKTEYLQTDIGWEDPPSISSTRSSQHNITVASMHPTIAAHILDDISWDLGSAIKLRIDFTSFTAWLGKNSHMMDVLLTQPPTTTMSGNGVRVNTRKEPFTVRTMMQALGSNKDGKVMRTILDPFVLDGSVVAKARAYALIDSVADDEWQKKKKKPALVDWTGNNLWCPKLSGPKKLPIV